MTKEKAVPGASPSQPRALPTKRFATSAAWESWLEQHHGRARGVWLRIAKRAAGVASVTYAEALEVALLFGWIDGQKRTLDAHFWLQKFTPRGPRSPWSQTNRASALRLIAAGRMRPGGLAAVASAKADGRWARAYAPPSRARVPPDLARELDAEPAARAHFATLDGRNRYAILYRVEDAKKPETRAKRIADFVRMLARGEALYPARKKRGSPARRLSG